MSDKRTVFQGMDFADTESKIPDAKPPLRFAPEKSNLNESSKAEFALKDDVKAFLEAQRDPSKKTSTSSNTHKIKAHQFSGGAIEDLILWTGDLLNVLAKKPCNAPESKFSTVEALLHGEASVNWKECMRECANKLVKSPNSNIDDHMVPAGCNEQSFKATLKKFLKSYYPACAGRIQMNYMRNYLKKSRKRTVKEHLRRLKELVNMANEIPDNVRPLEAFEITDIFYRMMPQYWQKQFQEAGVNIHTMTVDELSDYFERLETLEAQESSNKSAHTPKKDHNKSKHGKHKYKGKSEYKKFCKTCKDHNRSPQAYNSHNTADCKAKYDKGGQNNKAYKKPWINKGNEKAFAKLVAKTVKQELKRSKRKRDESSSDEE